MDITMDRRAFTATAAFLGAGAIAANGTPGLAQTPDRPQLAQNAAGAQSPNPAPVALAPPDRQPAGLKVPEPVARKAGWAIVGLGGLALEEVMPAFGSCKLSRPTALVSGHPDKARKVAQVYGVDPANIYDYDTFDRMIDNPAIDIVYIVLPNSMHAEFTIRALKAGKHVLCEKPMAVTVAESEQMIAAAKQANRKLMIAYRLHYEPLNRKVVQLCEDKVIGPIKTFVSSNSQDVKAPNIRLSGKLGGGPVGDLGVYSINAARYCLGEEPVEVTAFAHRPKDDPRFAEVPESVAFTLRFPSGALANCDCSFGSSVSRSYQVHGAKGVITMDPAFAYNGLRLELKLGDEKKGDASKAQLLIEQVDHFAAEMDHFSDCVLNGREPRTPGEEGLADMRIVEAIARSIETGRPVRIAG